MALIPINLAAAEARPTQWWWEGRVPFGRVTGFEGLGDVGKSSQCRSLIARRSAGRQLPFGEQCLPAAGSVILASLEESAATIQRQLVAEGADMDRILIDDHRPRPIELPRDLDALDRAIDAVGADSVVLDPMIERIPAIAGSEKQVRDALGPVVAWAEQRQVAVLAIRHWAKAGNGPPKNRGLGSVAIANYMRSIMCCIDHPASDNPFERILLPVKHNLWAAEPLVYRTVKRPDGIIVVEWLDVYMGNSRDLLGATDHRKIALAIKVLTEELREGPRPSKEVNKAMSEVGVSGATASRARAFLDIRHEKVGHSWVQFFPRDQWRVDAMRRGPHPANDDDDFGLPLGV